MQNEFQIELVKFINGLDLPIKARLDYFNEYDDIVVNSLPGGKVERMYMDETKEVSLPFEIAVKSKDNQLANGIIWKVCGALSEVDVTIESPSQSYTFIELSVDRPANAGKDEQDFFIYTLSINALLKTERK